MRFNGNERSCCPHDPRCCTRWNRLFKLTQRGDLWFAISPDLTHNEVGKTATVGSDAETYGTITTLAESPLERGRIWVGTDDGRVQLTTNEGKNWSDVTPPQVGGLYVARVAASAHEPRTAYVAVDGHRSDVFDPKLLRTRDDAAPGPPSEAICRRANR